MDGDASLFEAARRIHPTAPDAEAALIGAIFANNAAYHRVADLLRPEHFADPIHARIFEMIERRIRAGQLVDAVILRGDLENSGTLDAVGGTPYLAKLLAAMVSVITASEYGRLIHGMWLRRRLIEIGTDVVNSGFDASEIDATGQLAQAMGALTELTQSTPATRVVSMGDAADEYLRSREAMHRGDPLAGVRCGFGPVDQSWGPLYNGRLFVLGGRPGVGKTALALQVAEGVARQLLAEQANAPPFSGAGGSVMVFSAEMTAAELGGRALAGVTAIGGSRLEDPSRLTPGDWKALQEAQGEIAGLPLVINDHSDLTSEEAILALQAETMRRRVRLAVFDHLHKFRIDPKQSRFGKANAIQQIAVDLKAAARRLNLPILLLAHLSRDMQKRADPRPVLEDLSYAGEGPADVVALIWSPGDHVGTKPEHNGRESEEALQRRKDAWQKQHDRYAGKVEMIIAKRRGGARSVVMLDYDGPTTSFHVPGVRPDTPMDAHW